ncbi:hypothetical protein ACP70R_004321 [Stipagrostis hirtigluma subsp. patula]
MANFTPRSGGYPEGVDGPCVRFLATRLRGRSLEREENGAGGKGTSSRYTMVAAAATARRSSPPWFCGCTADSVAVAVAAGANRPAGAAVDGLASAARQITQCSASDQLKQARDVFVAKEAVLQKKIAQEMERAKEFTKSGNKQAAMQCLKRKKYYESQMNQVGSVQLRINTKEKMIADHMGNK